MPPECAPVEVQTSSGDVSISGDAVAGRTGQKYAPRPRSHRDRRRARSSSRNMCVRGQPRPSTASGETSPSKAGPSASGDVRLKKLAVLLDRHFFRGGHRSPAPKICSSGNVRLRIPEKQYDCGPSLKNKDGSIGSNLSGTNQCTRARSCRSLTRGPPVECAPRPGRRTSANTRSRMRKDRTPWFSAHLDIIRKNGHTSRDSATLRASAPGVAEAARAPNAPASSSSWPGLVAVAAGLIGAEVSRVRASSSASTFAPSRRSRATPSSVSPRSGARRGQRRSSRSTRFPSPRLDNLPERASTRAGLRRCQRDCARRQARERGAAREFPGDGRALPCWWRSRRCYAGRWPVSCTSGTPRAWGPSWPSARRCSRPWCVPLLVGDLLC